MNEAETRAERIDPALKTCGWGVMQDTKVFREFHITHGKIQTGGTRSKPLIADYLYEKNDYSYSLFFGHLAIEKLFNCISKIHTHDK